MGTMIYPTVPVAQPAAEPWPPNGMNDDDPIGIQADEMFARQLDTGFAAEIRTLMHDPETGRPAPLGASTLPTRWRTSPRSFDGLGSTSDCM
jgi:hypothetical protein